MGSGSSAPAAPLRSIVPEDYLADQVAALKLEMKDHPRMSELDSAVDNLSQMIQSLRTENQDLKAKLAAKKNATQHQQHHNEDELPPQLRGFIPLCHEPAVQMVVGADGFRGAEATMQNNPSEATALALQKELKTLTAALKTALNLRLRKPGILQKCQNVALAGNKNFVSVYNAVWDTIKNNEADGLKQYIAAIDAAEFPAKGARQGVSTAVELIRDGAATREMYEKAVQGIVASTLKDGTAKVIVPPLKSVLRKCTRRPQMRCLLA